MLKFKNFSILILICLLMGCHIYNKQKQEITIIPIIRPRSLEINSKTANKLRHLIKDEITFIQVIDFNGDKEEDYIVQVNAFCKNMHCIPEYWVTSKYKVVKKTCSPEAFSYGLSFRLFINIDNDPEPEIFEFTSWDGTYDEHKIYDINLKTYKYNAVINISPVFINEKGVQSSYELMEPEITKGVYVFKNTNFIKIGTSFKHGIIDCGDVLPILERVYKEKGGTKKAIEDIMNNFCDVKAINYPVIFFNISNDKNSIKSPKVGKVKIEDNKYTNIIEEIEWLTFEQIIEKSKKTKNTLSKFIIP